MHKTGRATAMVSLAPLVLLAGVARPAEGQSLRASRYQSRTPTVSPYLDLFRANNNALLPNYYTFVRPKQQIQVFEQRQAATNALVLRSLQRQAAASGGAAPRSPGRVGGFMNFLHFYPQADRR